MIATAVLCAQYAGTLDLLDTTTLRARATQSLTNGSLQPPIYQAATTTEAGKEIVIGGDFSTVASARLRLADRSWEYVLSYSPMLTLADVELGLNATRTLVLQNATASVGWHDRFVRVSVTESASYGFLYTLLPYQPTAAAAPAPMGNTPAPAPTPGPPPPPGGTSTVVIAAPRRIEYGTSDTQGAVSVLVERHSSLAFSGGYLVSGGLTSDGQQIIPERFGPHAEASFTTSPSVTDSRPWARSR
jgi:hypothetical protein